MTHMLIRKQLTEASKMSKNFYKVTTKCGHVGKQYFVEIDFPVYAENAKEAAKIARSLPRVKHNHKDAIRNVQEISKQEFIELKRKNNEDQYLMCSSKQEQNQLCDDLLDRLITETHKNKYFQEKTRDKKVVDYKRQKNNLRNSYSYRDWAYDIA